MNRKLYGILALGILSGAILLLAACTGTPGPAGPPGPAGSAGLPGSPATITREIVASLTPGTGLHAEITKVEIGADNKPVVTFVIHDGKGVPLRISDLDGNPSFIIASLKEDTTSKITQWAAYTVGDAKGAPYTFEGQTIQPVLAEVKGRPVVDPQTGAPAFPAPNPALKDLGNGTYTYTFSTALPADYDKSATHRVAGQITRATRTFASNPIFDFVPAGGAVQLTRDVVTTASCNQCHDPLSLHGGSRVETKYCVTCHTSQNTDPETGNTVEFKNMVHKIHRGDNLPSVQAGDEYLIVGYRQTVFNFGHVVWPKFGGTSGSTIGDVRTCTTCHGTPPVTTAFPNKKSMSAEEYAKLAPNADNWKTKPSRAACGACHDQIDWETGKSTITGRNDHKGGPQTDDNACAACHVADSGKEFDASVVGAHTIPAESKQVKGINVDIVRVTNTAPGQNPVVVFTAKDKAGNNLQLSEITSMTVNINGPTTDYLNQPTTESVTLSKVNVGANGNFSYTMTRAIPTNATGSYAIGLEARRTEAIIGNEGATTNVSGASYNPVVYVPVTDKTAVPRRQIVATENCNVCHEKIAFHGGGRLNTGEYCQLCHNPVTVDVPERTPPTFGGPFDIPPQSINFKLLIHRIHTGEELTRDFTIYRTRGVFNFNQVEFPGDRSNCAKCHVKESFALPLPETAADTIAPREFYSPLGPAAAACLGCHDNKPAAAHAKTMTADIGEACANCHGRGKDFDVLKVH